MDEPAGARHGRIAPLTVAVAVAVVVLDQLTKWWAVRTLDDRDIDLFWTLRLNLSFNTGMAFSRGENWGPLIGVVAMVIVVVLLLSMRRSVNRLTDVTVGLIIGGAIGNIIDRLFRSPGWLRGGVVDFIDFQWFPIFNVADMAITIGGALLVISSWIAGRQTRAPAAPSAPETT
jgi:signal peptidase II